MPDEKPAFLPENLVNEKHGKSHDQLSAHCYVSLGVGRETGSDSEVPVKSGFQ
jgi:hypothetical protein